VSTKVGCKELESFFRGTKICSFRVVAMACQNRAVSRTTLASSKFSSLCLVYFHSVELRAW
jgi:hypothetical protein